MLPSFLSSTYKQYKTDSDAVATWLATTAQHCGYAKDLLTNEGATEQKAPRLKGRARKLAREVQSLGSQNESLKPNPTPEGPKYLITIDDFVSLAEWIAKSTKPRVKVPASFTHILDRAIILRKRQHSWWYKKDERNDGSSQEAKLVNDSHGYFIGVLEKVREILKPSMPAELRQNPLTRPAEGSAITESPHGQMTNQFENLHMEEPSDDFLNAESPPSGQSPNMTPQVRYSVDQAEDLDEVYFAVCCLFEDLQSIRRYLHHVWDGYKQGVFDLVAVSITTNTAIDFAKRLQEDFDESFPKHTDFEKHTNSIYHALCLANHQDPTVKERPDDDMNFKVYEDADQYLFPACILLSSFCRAIKPGIFPTYKPGYYGVYDASSGRASKSPRDKFIEDKIMLLEILPDFCIMARGNDSIPAEDEMTRGIREMVKQRKAPIWLVFAAQVFLDINHILRDQVSRGFDDLVRSAKYVEGNIQHVLKFHEKLRVDTWPRSNDQALLQILDRITTWVKNDVVASVQARMKGSPELYFAHKEPFQLLRHHPLYCGLLSYSIKALAQEASIVFVNAWGSILYCAHLYNALRQDKLLSNAWPDMDLALIMHRTEDMFIGEFPKTTDDYFKRFCRAMGHSASMFAKNRRQSGVVASKAGSRSLNEISPVSRMFRSRYCHNDVRANLSLDDVATILEHADEDDDADFDDPNGWEIPRIRIDARAETPSVGLNDEAQVSKPKQGGRKNQRSASTGIRQIQLLNALLNAVQSEIVELTFDHFRLHRSSWRLLRALKQELGGDLREIYGPAYLEVENQLPFIVGYIFMTAVQTSKLAGLLLPKKKDVVTSRLLVKAAGVMREMLESGIGAIEIKILREHMGMEIEVPDILGFVGSRTGSGTGEAQ